MSEEQNKDARFNYRQIKSTAMSKGSKGEERVQLSFTKEGVQELIATLQSLADNERGVKLDAHIYEQEKEGRTFKSTVMFVKAIHEFGHRAPGAGAPKFKSAFPKKDVAAVARPVTKTLV